MTSLGNEDDVALIGTTDNVNTSYNMGPRQATDKYFAGFFLANILVFIIWGSVGIAGNGATVFLLDYDTEKWIQDTTTTCCNVDVSGCHEKNQDFQAALNSGAVSFLTDPNSDPSATNNDTSVCLSSFSDTELKGYFESPILWGVFGSILMGCLILLGFRQIPYTMVYFVVLFKITVPAAVGVMFMTGDATPSASAEGCEPTDSISPASCDSYATADTCNLANDNDCTWNSGSAAASSTTAAYGCFAVSAILAVIFYMYRRELDLCARLFKVSSKALTANWQLMPVNIVFAVVVIAAKCGMLVMILLAVLTANVTPDPDYYGPGGSQAGRHPCSPQIRDSWYQFTSYGIFVVTWFGFWALETRDYIVGDTIGAWYWHGTKGASTTRAVKHAFCSHFGTMAFAGLVMYFVEYLKKKAKYRGPNVLLCVVKTCAMCILSYIEFLCKMSVLMTAITGNHFVGSGKKVVQLFTQSFGDMKASTGVWWIPAMIISVFVKICSLVFAVLAGYTMYNVISTHGDSVQQSACDTSSLALFFALGIGLIVLILMLFLLAFFGQILITTVDTVYLCYIIDRSKGVVTHQDLHDILGEVIGKRKDVKLLEVQMNQQQQIQQAPPAYNQQQQQFAQPPQQQQQPQQPQQYAQQPQQFAQQQQQQFAQQPQQQQFAQQPQQFAQQPQQFAQQPQQFAQPQQPQQYAQQPQQFAQQQQPQQFAQQPQQFAQKQ